MMQMMMMITTGHGKLGSGHQLVALGVLLAAFALQFSGGEAVKCYICSWSPVENNTDIKDFCTAENFNADLIKSFKCTRGCEYVSNYDRNGVIVDFHRNCANDVAPTALTCRKTPGKEKSRYACSCNEDLCNGVHSGSDSAARGPITASLIVVAIAIALSGRS